MKNKAIMFTIISALLYGFTPVLCAKTYSLGNNPITMTFFRSVFVLPILASIMTVNKISLKINRTVAFKVIVIGIFGSVLTTLLLYSSYNYIGVGTTTTLHFLYPLFVVAICSFVYKDKVTKKQITALFLAMIGVCFFVEINDLTKIKGVVMALLSGVTFAVYLVGIEKLGLSKMNNYKLSFYFALIVFISLLIVNIFTNQLQFIQPVESYLIMFLVGVLASFIALIFLKIGIEVLGSSLASMICLFEPISCVIFGYIFLNEKIDLFMIIGCILIISAISMLVNKKKSED